MSGRFHLNTKIEIFLNNWHIFMYLTIIVYMYICPKTFISINTYMFYFLKQVHMVIKSCSDEQGLSITYICNKLRGIPQKEIRYVLVSTYIDRQHNLYFILRYIR